MRRLFPRPAVPLDPVTWARRHRALLLVAVLQGLLITAWSVSGPARGVHLLAHLAPVWLPVAVALVPRHPRWSRSGAVALALFGESALLVHLADGAPALHFHFFVMLVLLGLYEDARPLVVGIGFVLVHHVGVGLLVPSYVFGAGEVEHPLRWALAHGAFVFAAAAAIVALRRASEAQRARLEQYLRLAGSMVVALDLEGRVTLANPAACRVLGRAEHEVVGQGWVTLTACPGDEVPRRRLVEAVRHGDLTPTEVDLRTAGGGRVRVAWHHGLVRDHRGRVTGTLSTGEDVTARRAAEAVLAREGRELALLRDLAHAVATGPDPRQAVVAGVAELTGACFASLSEPRAAGAVLEVTATTAPGLAGVQVAVGPERSGTGEAFRTGRAAFYADAQDDPALGTALVRTTGARSVLLQPVLRGEEVLGVLAVGWPDRVASVAAREAALVALAAGEASVALQRHEATRRLEETARTDALTGCANRRRWDEELGRELARAARSGAPLAVAVLDLNGFKALNDARGHDAGDDLLRDAALAWGQELRPSDLLARLGGDEFAVLLPDCGDEEAERVAARLREVTPTAAGAAVGTAVWDRTEDPAALLRRADGRLYADKAGAHLARLREPARLAATREAIARADRGALDELAARAAWLLEAPIALVSLVTEDRQCFAGLCGLSGAAREERGTPLSHSLCQHAVASGRTLLVPDVREDPLLAAGPAVTDLGVVAYAGVPLAADGEVVGVLCVVDTVPRTWTADEVAALHHLARRAAALLSPAGVRAG